MRKQANNQRRFSGFLTTLIGVLGLLFLVRCVSTDSVPADGSEGAQGASVFMPPATYSPSLAKLLERLKTMGYDGVGLEFEGESTLEFLGRIFQSPRVAGRKIKLTYTGMALSYDPKHESLTIGGTTDPEVVLKYVEKNIPLKPASASK